MLKTGTADAKGALLFRDLTPGAGYTVREGGQTSDPVTVLDPANNPPQSSYDGVNLTQGFGYIPTRDGTKLSVNITFPKDGSPGPWPVLVDYSGYDPSEPNQTPSEAQIYAYFGYVVVGVNMRGTTCSGGAFWFFEDAQRTDGYDAIETLAHQSWSNGDVGMVGISYSGYSQLYVAATRPPHLRAITPLSPYSDTFRGILYPGGILNNGFALGWALDRQEASAPAAHQWVKNRISGGDTTCANNQVLRLQSQDLASEITPGRFADPKYAYLDVSSFAPLINVPTFLATQWQDEQTGGYGVELATEIAKHAKLRVELTNGTHVDSLGPEDFLRVTEFVDLYVGKRMPRNQANGLYRDGIISGLESLFGSPITLPPARFQGYNDYASVLAAYEAEPPVRIRWENGAVSGKEGMPYATVATTYAAWPIPNTTAQRWYLGADGQLTSAAPTTPDTQRRGYSSYTYDPTVKRTSTYSGSTDSMWLAHPNVHWDTEDDGNSLSFITPAFTQKKAYAGNGSVDLWVRSSAADTDFEVTLTEVRPDGKEVNIQSGWLRASRRALDVAGSTVLRPRGTFQEADASPLPAGVFTPVRIELFPFAQIVRPGSRLRLSIEAPGGNQPFWAFDALDGTATNDIAHSAGRPSSVVLPLLNDSAVTFWSPSTVPSCNVSGVTTQSQTLRNQPCRDYVTSQAPTGVTATVGTGRIHVAWQPSPVGVGQSTPTGYRVTAFPYGSTFDVGAGVTSYDYAPFLGTPLEFTVAPLFGSTAGTQSDASAPITPPTPGTPTAVASGSGAATISWTAPPSFGTPVTGYVVTPWVSGSPQSGTPFTAGATSGTISTLSNGVPYTFTVKATYGTGPGPDSAQSAAVTVGVPSQPVLANARPGNGSAVVQWWPANGNGATVTGSIVTPYINGVAQPAQTFNTGANAQTVTGLTNGVTYTFKVAAVNSRGASTQSAATNAVAAGAPGAPALQTAQPGNGSATVSWYATPNGAPITSTIITPYAGTTALAPQTFNSGASNAVVTGLTNGTAYTFKIVSHNAYGDSLVSPATAPIVAGTPTAPVLQKATAGAGQATVQWWPPNANGSPVTSFVVTPYIGTVAQTPRTFTVIKNTQIVTGLTPGTTYTFKIYAVNSVGAGVVSGATNAVTVT